MRDIRLWQVTGPSKTAAAAPRKHRTVQTFTRLHIDQPEPAGAVLQADRSPLPQCSVTVIQGIALLLARSWADVSECSPLSFTALFASNVRTATTHKCMAPSFMRAAAKQASTSTPSMG